jgi:hypothetical protein
MYSWLKSVSRNGKTAFSGRDKRSLGDLIIKVRTGYIRLYAEWRRCFGSFIGYSNLYGLTLTGKQMVENTCRQQWIAEAAYYRAEARQFVGGNALEDWLAAEEAFIRVQVARYLTIAEEDGGMTLMGLRQLAESLGVENFAGLELKSELIQAIQAACHHHPCFRSAIYTQCGEKDCQWRAECKKLIAHWCAPF